MPENLYAAWRKKDTGITECNTTQCSIWALLPGPSPHRPSLTASPSPPQPHCLTLTAPASLPHPHRPSPPRLRLTHPVRHPPPHRSLSSPTMHASGFTPPRHSSLLLPAREQDRSQALSKSSESTPHGLKDLNFNQIGASWGVLRPVEQTGSLADDREVVLVED